MSEFKIVTDYERISDGIEIKLDNRRLPIVEPCHEDGYDNDARYSLIIDGSTYYKGQLRDDELMAQAKHHAIRNNWKAFAWVGWRGYLILEVAA